MTLGMFVSFMDLSLLGSSEVPVNESETKYPPCPGECVHAITSVLCSKVIDGLYCGASYLRCCVTSDFSFGTVVETSAPLNDEEEDHPIHETDYDIFIVTTESNNKLTSLAEKQTEAPESNSTTSPVEENSKKERPCSGICVESPFVRYCGTIIKEGICDEGFGCCATNTKIQPQSSSILSPTLSSNKTTSSHAQASSSNKVGTLSPPEQIYTSTFAAATQVTVSTTPSGPPCPGSCVAPLFSLLCDIVRDEYHCPNEGRCCVPEDDHTTTTEPPVVKCPGACIPAFLSGMCTKPAELLIRTDCDENFFCCHQPIHNTGTPNLVESQNSASLSAEEHALHTLHRPPKLPHLTRPLLPSHLSLMHTPNRQPYNPNSPTLIPVPRPPSKAGPSSHHSPQAINLPPHFSKPGMGMVHSHYEHKNEVVAGNPYIPVIVPTDKIIKGRPSHTQVGESETHTEFNLKRPNIFASTSSNFNREHLILPLPHTQKPTNAEKEFAAQTSDLPSKANENSMHQSNQFLLPNQGNEHPAKHLSQTHAQFSQPHQKKKIHEPISTPEIIPVKTSQSEKTKLHGVEIVYGSAPFSKDSSKVTHTSSQNSASYSPSIFHENPQKSQLFPLPQLTNEPSDKVASDSFFISEAVNPEKMTLRPIETHTSSIDSPICPGPCIASFLRFTCFSNHAVYNGFTCMKAGTMCCAPVEDIEKYEKKITSDPTFSMNKKPEETAVPSSTKNHPYVCGKKSNLYKRAETPRVVGGRIAVEGEFCWQVAIINDSNQYLCGGSLISNRYVLTAAHCITSSVRNGDPIFVRLGDFNLASEYGSAGAQTLKVSASYIHHNHNGQTLDNDIALLRMEHPATLNDNVCLVCLPARGATSEPGKRCIVTGYGYESENGPISLKIRQAELPIVPDKLCVEQVNNVTEKLFILPTGSFCAGGEPGHDACSGDGGGPLVCQNDGFYDLIGIVSWGFGCGKAYVPGVYVKVSSYIGWINQIISVNN